MHYGAENDVLAPRVRGVYDIIVEKPFATVLASECVPGVVPGVMPGVMPVDVWDDWCCTHVSRNSIARLKWKKTLERWLSNNPSLG